MTRARNVADLRDQTLDAIGNPIVCLYGLKAPEYGVYSTANRVLVHFADDPDTSRKQRRELSQLASLRGEIDGLIDGWRSGRGKGWFADHQLASLKRKASCFERRVGDALIVALEEDIPRAQELLIQIKQDIIEERTAWARFEYLLTAFVSALGLMFVAWLLAATLPISGEEPGARAQRLRDIGLIVLALIALGGLGVVARFRLGEPAPATEQMQSGSRLTDWLRGLLPFAALGVPVVALFIWPSSPTGQVRAGYENGIDLWRAAAAGSVGAFFSISLAIRGRTVLTDLRRTSNIMDALLRVTIGFIAGGVLMALMSADLFMLSFGQTQVKATVLGVLIAGFVAGFAERFVPDLLEQAAARPVEPSERSAPRKPATTTAPAEAEQKVAPEPAIAPANDDTDLVDDEVEVGKEGFDLDDDEATDDAELPAAAGGVAKLG